MVITSATMNAPSRNARRVAASLLSLAVVLAGCSPEPAPDQQALENEAREIAQRFVGTLLPTLQEAMQSGGPAGAIEVCAVRAPAIAATLSQESGWQVRRVSLKTRNSELATPDAWEASNLQDFDRRQLAGEPAPTLTAASIVDREFRFLQAQPVMPLCLNCHGTELAPEVVSALQQHYPDDLARGYSLGQVRGAISLRRALD